MARVIVVDDEEQVREMLKETLSQAGHEVLTAANGDEALATHRDHTANVVVTDILMPHKEGIETIRELRRESPELKIIAYTGGGRNEPEHYLRYARSFGADRTFSKPMDIDTLIGAIDELLGGVASPS